MQSAVAHVNGSTTPSHRGTVPVVVVVDVVGDLLGNTVGLSVGAKDVEVIVVVAEDVAVVVIVVDGEVRSHSNTPLLCSEIIAFRVPTKVAQLL